MKNEIKALLKLLYWIGGVCLGGFVLVSLGGGNENLAETNAIYWIGEAVFAVGWFVGMSYLASCIWKD